MNENELIKELMSEYFYEITDENYLDKYNYLFDSPQDPYDENLTLTDFYHNHKKNTQNLCKQLLQIYYYIFI